MESTIKPKAQTKIMSLEYDLAELRRELKDTIAERDLIKNKYEESEAKMAVMRETLNQKE